MRRRAFCGKHAWVAAALLVMAAMACSGCSSSAKSVSRSTSSSSNNANENVLVNASQCGKTTRVIKHDLGRTTITGTPRRIVALEFSFVDALASVGIKPVGIAEDGSSAKIIPQLRDKIGSYTSVGLRQSPNMQVITSLKPDLIIADTERDKTIYPQLSKIAPTISLDSLQAGYQQNLDSMSVIAQAVNDCSAMAARLTAHQKAMKSYASQLHSEADGKFLFAVAFDKGFVAHTAADYISGALQSIGLTCALPASGSTTNDSMTLETLVSTNPDILFIANSTPTTVVDGWKSNPLWKNISAVKKHAVYIVDDNLWARSRGLTSSELVAKQVVSDLSGK